MYVSEIENIWKESQEAYDANQRELNCLQLELVKSDNKLLYDYIFSEGNAIYSSSQLSMNIDDSHNFVIWKSFFRFNQCGSVYRKWGHIFDAIICYKWHW